MKFRRELARDRLGSIRTGAMTNSAARRGVAMGLVSRRARRALS
jgi:hypothetical protein